jgi:hypothetical protein
MFRVPVKRGYVCLCQRDSVPYGGWARQRENREYEEGPRSCERGPSIPGEGGHPGILLEGYFSRTILRVRV